ncbi:DUF6607 family protein [uncultured Aquimarina sp.]|uniref:DUF6607 family protein n=1 Tax=uncultured Aquimarina sp. TaxID=575652 RepID=UPI0026217510|nr:DUF6607 family protein [uncultured Aquimarina sp.]
MKISQLVIVVSLLTSSVVIGQVDKKANDLAAIKSMCGCYEVSFNFAETFNYSNDSLYKPSKTKKDSKALEWAELVVDKENKIAIQHILQVGDPSKPHIVKHWRQDWVFENRDFYMYDGDNNWKYVRKPEEDVKGQWSQKVYQVDDSPRYEGSASWVHVDGKSFWENTTTAPLPRREYTTRSDYNITMRGNRQEITETGWIHDQDNDKIIREAGKEDIIIAKEKGNNIYTRVDDKRCAGASNWWKEHNDKWVLVRSKWEEVFGRNTDLSLEQKVENKALYKHLFTEDYQAENDINTIIESFVKK